MLRLWRYVFGPEIQRIHRSNDGRNRVSVLKELFTSSFNLSMDWKEVVPRFGVNLWLATEMSKFSVLYLFLHLLQN